MPGTVENEMLPILVVEDSEDDFDALKRAFGKVGVSNPIHHVFSGAEAIAYLKKAGEQLPCIMLLDLNMPGLDGRRTLQIIKHDGELRHMPVVIFTTSNYDHDVRICYELGANTYIQKPVDFDRLVSAARHIKEYWLEIASLPHHASHAAL